MNLISRLKFLCDSFARVVKMFDMQVFRFLLNHFAKLIPFLSLFRFFSLPFTPSVALSTRKTIIIKTSFDYINGVNLRQQDGVPGFGQHFGDLLVTRFWSWQLQCICFYRSRLETISFPLFKCLKSFFYIGDGTSLTSENASESRRKLATQLLKVLDSSQNQPDGKCCSRSNIKLSIFL